MTRPSHRTTPLCTVLTGGTDIPAGNGIITAVEGDRIHLQPDNRDSCPHVAERNAPFFTETMEYCSRHRH
ncbi:MAG: hypothetical protein JJU00_01670 [Opitutales bacterium]|nr:hypothetical protein [Opitutales bacterium]